MTTALTVYDVEKRFRQGEHTRALQFLRHYCQCRKLEASDTLFYQEQNEQVFIAQSDDVTHPNILAFDIEEGKLIPLRNACDAIFHKHFDHFQHVEHLILHNGVSLHYDKEVLGHLLYKLGDVELVKQYWAFARNIVRTIIMVRETTSSLAIVGDRAMGQLMSETPKLSFPYHETGTQPVDFGHYNKD